MTFQPVRTADFDYSLPDHLVAQSPLEPRDSARLLVLDRRTGSLAHHTVRDLPALLGVGDLLVANRSRVLPARVRGHLVGGGQVELLLLRKLGPGRWQTLARPGRRLRMGTVITIAPDLLARVTGIGEAGVREVTLEAPGESERDLDAALLATGSVPLPPYIRGWVGDPERYQTVFAEVEGSAAAPTAGLHFTPDLLARLSAAGVDHATVTLHVGVDTFRPLTVEDPANHRLHREWYEVPPATAEQIRHTRERGGRVVAVGTTCVRTLEAWSLTGASSGWTDLFIRPGFRFRAVDALLTNFHLPRSTLLMLVSAFATREQVLDAYATAIQLNYRFYSFGDAMLVL